MAPDTETSPTWVMVSASAWADMGAATSTLRVAAMPVTSRTDGTKNPASRKAKRGSSGWRSLVYTETRPIAVSDTIVVARTVAETRQGA